MMRPTIFALGFVLALGTIGAHAEDGEARSHDRGLFLRLAPGLGFFKTKLDVGPQDASLEGAAASGDAAIGYCLKHNFAVHATVFGSSVNEPKLKYGGRRQNDLKDVTVDLQGFGAGVTYYLGETNVYLTGSLGFARLLAHSDHVTVDSDTGGVLELGAGKEWWISDRWALGVGLGLTAHRVPAPKLDRDFKGAALDIRFSATMD